MGPSFWFSALLASVAITQCTVAGQEPSMISKAGSLAGEPVVRFVRATDDYELLQSGLTPSELLNSAEGFLAGETTPVFEAFKRKGRPVVYTRVHKDFVKRAVDWWMSSARNHTGYGNLIRPSGPTPDVLYPSVLAVLDYDGGITENYQGSREVWIKEGILYALSFWSGVDLQLRYIGNPSVRIRLAGIILGNNREATPYIHENQDGSWIDADKAIVPTMAYWRNLVRTNQNFNSMMFDTVAVMTQTDRAGHWQGEISAPTAADTRSICSGGSKGINGLIVHDNLAYAGIQPAVHSMARIFGASRGENPGCSVQGTVMETDGGTTERGYGRTWAGCTLTEIRNYLSAHGSCMASPKEYYDPGKPVPAILPGKFLSVKDLCQTYYPNVQLYDCFPNMKNDPCGELMCTEDKWSYPCSNMHTLIPDGSWCDVGFSGNGRKICLDGKCVRDPTRR